MLSVSQLFIYPVKSLGGISVDHAVVTNTGLQYDRKWMLVDDSMRCITQRELPSLALLQAEITGEGLKIYHKLHNEEFILIPFLTGTGKRHFVQIFDDITEAIFVNAEADNWFSKMLSVKCRLVYMPDSIKRLVDEKYAKDNEVTGFADAFPFLIIGQASLRDLNCRLVQALPMNRFRPNIVFTGGKPYQEDIMEHFTISGINFYGVKLCARCIIPTINQNTAHKLKEPLKTLATYRQKNNKIYFGQNLLAAGTGTLSIGDVLEIKKVNASDALSFKHCYKRAYKKAPQSGTHLNQTVLPETILKSKSAKGPS